jgi:hypothetical protein
MDGLKVSQALSNIEHLFCPCAGLFVFKLVESFFLLLLSDLRLTAIVAALSQLPNRPQEVDFIGNLWNDIGFSPIST